MKFELLSADGEDARRWSGLIDVLPFALRDIHYLPEYGRIYRDAYGYEPFLAVYSEGDYFVLQPFVRRPLATLPFLNADGDATRFSDLANAYGYGGPLSTAPPLEHRRQLYRALTESMRSHCEQTQIASEFTSLHPLMLDHQLPMIEGIMQPNLEKEVVFIPLNGGEADLHARVNRGHKSSIAKARRAGVTVAKVDPTPANLDLLHDLYHQTMRRRAAAERWFLPASFFLTCVEALGGARVSLFFARVDGEVESAYFLMHDFRTAYYHFAGSRGARPEVRANNLLMYETAEWARKSGFEFYYLGGGVTRMADDSLFRFKGGFSQARAPLYTYFWIRDRKAYEELCIRKRRFERATGGAELSSDFLPLYRR